MPVKPTQYLKKKDAFWDLGCCNSWMMNYLQAYSKGFPLIFINQILDYGKFVTSRTCMDQTTTSAF